MRDSAQILVDLVNTILGTDTDSQFPKALRPIGAVALVVEHAEELHAAGCRLLGEDDDEATADAIAEARATVDILRTLADELAEVRASRT